MQDYDRRMDRDMVRAGVLPPKPCGCTVGFCRADTLLDALTQAVMWLNPATQTTQLDALDDAYRAQAAECCGGFRITQD